MFSSAFMRSITDITLNQSQLSSDMAEQIDLWLNMFSGNAPWISDTVQSMSLSSTIATEIARAVTLEMKAELSGSDRADYIAAQLKPVLRNVRNTVEYACAGGGVVFKPIVNGDSVQIEIIQPNVFFPIAYDNAQRITAAFFLYRRYEGKKIYSRLERHELNGTDYTITNRCFVSELEQSIGKEVSLSSVDAWAEIEPEVVLHNIDSPLFAYFKIPIGNTFDMRSPIGTSVYARAVDLIKEADKQYSRLLWEYEAGEMAIDASEDVFRRNPDGSAKIPEGRERLFRVNALAQGEGDAMKAWTPALRDANYKDGLNQLLMRIEDACSLARGSLCDADTTVRTATELKINKQRAYAMVTDIQKALEGALDELVHSVDTLCTLYDLAPSGEVKTVYVWDDSIIVDAATERQQDIAEVHAGLMNAWEFRVKWYGETEEQAKAALDTLSATEQDIQARLLEE